MTTKDPQPPAPFKVTIGLEIHIQLNTRSKLFCPCPTTFAAPPNSAICPVCAGFPGAMPVLNKGAVERALTLASAMGCTLERASLFSRKHYSYGDLPKGYQITQYDTPFARGGQLPTALGTFPLERIHLEEDAGKLIHDRSPKESVIDLNRAGVPLLEVVTTPSMSRPEEAEAFARRLHQLAVHLGISDGEMSQGSLRVDGNISIGTPQGPRGARVEIKNLNSFRFLRVALAYEIQRQGARLARGEAITAETRGFDPQKGVTLPQRAKEGAGAYRYMIEPDLGALVLGEEQIEATLAALPELPWEVESRLMDAYGLEASRAQALGGNAAMTAYFEDAAQGPGDGESVAKLMMGPLAAHLKEAGAKITQSPIAPQELGTLARWILDGTLTYGGAKVAMEAIIKGEGTPSQVVDALGLRPLKDESALEAMVLEVLAAHPQVVDDYRGGRTRLLGFLMGRVMALSRGRGAPKVAKAILLKHLEAEST